MESCAALSPGKPGPGADSVWKDDTHSLGLTSPAVGRQGAWKLSPCGLKTLEGALCRHTERLQPRGQGEPPASCPRRSGSSVSRQLRLLI